MPAITSTGDLPLVPIGANQWVRAKADQSAFEAATIYNQPDWAITDSSDLGYIKNKPSIGNRTFNNPSRSLNTAFQISSSQDALVSYAVDISATLSLSGGQTGTVTLQYADDSGFTTNVKTIQSGTSGNTGTLTVGLNLTNTGTVTLSGVVPAGKYVKLVTANTTGTPTFAYRSASETLL